jgi:CRISPR-associated protein Csm2
VIKIKMINQELKGEETLDRVRVNIIRLTPQLAYAKGRSLIDEDFYQISKELLSKVDSPEDFKKFADIMEAIVAYHRYYNPKEQ